MSTDKKEMVLFKAHVQMKMRYANQMASVQVLIDILNRFSDLTNFHSIYPENSNLV